VGGALKVIGTLKGKGNAVGGTPTVRWRPMALGREGGGDVERKKRN